MNRPAVCAHQRGLSMVELLVTTLVLSLGLLGVSGLMFKGISNAVSMDLQSRATQSAHEIIDAMRANPLQAGDYLVPWATDPLHIEENNLARRDVKRWLLNLRQLPGGDGQIKQVGATTQYTVSVRFAYCVGTISDAERDRCTKTPTQTRDFSFTL